VLTLKCKGSMSRVDQILGLDVKLTSVTMIVARFFGCGNNGQVSPYRET